MENNFTYYIMKKTDTTNTIFNKTYEEIKIEERKHDKKITFWLTILAYFVAVGLSILFGFIFVT